MVKPVQHEWSDQRSVAAFLSKALPPDAYWTSIDVGRSTSAQIGALRKARGIRSGIPDVLIVYRGVTQWIELKHDTSLSPNQELTRDALLRNGHRWALARSVEEVEAACRDAGIPLRATLGQIRTRITEQNERLPPKPKRAARSRRAVKGVSVARAHKMNLWG